ncbi:AAA family ATPase [Streptomyces actinomycinicus]|uniref:AAA family ATPase n=1 Tax=Streptomyces actinomycinicus TaxID=1695166 RepID=A0A937EJD0_9ACTN|nr:AAA family ATPase [Streptomyces actinomycinicus]MBL1084217.1 AAA family ATPase [Streptomyces actinomycinicus]
MSQNSNEAAPNESGPEPTTSVPTSQFRRPSPTLCLDHDQHEPCLHRSHWAQTDIRELTFHSLAAVAAEVDAAGPPRWLFKGVIVAGDYGVMSAEDKAGKTWAVIDAAVSCAAGLAWFVEFACEDPGPVLVFFGEGSRRKAVRRIRAVAESKGLTREQADALPIVLCFRAPRLGNAEHLELFRQAAALHRPKLVIVDPLYLAAGGAKGSDLYSMGELLQKAQHVAQEIGASLIISHHWNKGGTGDGHDRASGVGPGAWGRFLISVAVKSRRTDPATGESTVCQKWSLRGDEIPDTEMGLIRRVYEEIPGDLSSAMHYSVQRDDSATSGSGRQDDLSPAERKLLEAMRTAGRPEIVRQLVDRIAAKHGHGLQRETCSRALNRLAGMGLVDQIAPERVGMAAQWFVVDEAAGQVA